MIRDRQLRLVEFVRQAGVASYDDLAARFGVSPFTIRRDVEHLAHSRLLTRVKGGAQRIDTPGQFSEARLPARMEINLKEKEEIAARTLDFIAPRDSIFLDGSSTITCLARAIGASGRSVTVLTNSVLVALELAEATSVRLVGLGGVFDRETMSFVGLEAQPAGASAYIDKAFFSCTGFVPEEGTFENAAFNRAVKRGIVEKAGKVFLLADSGKFGKRAMNRVIETAEIDVLVTDRVSPGDKETLAAAGVEVHACGGDDATPGQPSEEKS